MPRFLCAAPAAVSFLTHSVSLGWLWWTVLVPCLPSLGSGWFGQWVVLAGDVGRRVRDIPLHSRHCGYFSSWRFSAPSWVCICRLPGPQKLAVVRIPHCCQLLTFPMPCLDSLEAAPQLETPPPYLDSQLPSWKTFPLGTLSVPLMQTGQMRHNSAKLRTMPSLEGMCPRSRTSPTHARPGMHGLPTPHFWLRSASLFQPSPSNSPGWHA